MAGERRESEVEDVGCLVNHVGARFGRSQLVCLLAELGPEQCGIGEQSRGVGAGRRREPAFGEAAGERAETDIAAPAGAGAQMAEARRLLADGEAERVAVAVGIDPEQVLRRTRGGALDPEAARARVVGGATLLQSGAERLEV